MKPEDCKIGAHVLVATTCPLPNNFIYHTKQPFSGKVVGRFPVKPDEYGYLCDDKGDVYLFAYEGTVLDPRYHYSKELADTNNGYGPFCLCGHHYNRHFDWTEQDDLYPDKLRRAGCKYCDCRLFTACTDGNSKNRLSERKAYKVRIARDVEVKQNLYKGQIHIPEVAKETLKAETVLDDVRVVDGDAESYTIFHHTSGQKHIVHGLPADAVEILDTFERGPIGG